MSGYLASLILEIGRQDGQHPGCFPATRDGLRLALAAAQDELDESRESWRDGRPRPGRDADWTACRTELVQLAAVALRAARSIDRDAMSRSKSAVVEMRRRVVVRRDEPVSCYTDSPTDPGR
jgi:hypothetical protein